MKRISSIALDKPERLKRATIKASVFAQALQEGHLTELPKQSEALRGMHDTHGGLAA